ncbi:MAG: DUF4270 family protein [Chitinophagaceae bacterium]|nr:DUF4270 family protein [Chitinophagaceae bacterium]
MKNRNLVFSFLAITASLITVLSACKKINEATELGSGLIPPVDNINTFETYLDIETDNKLFNDTTKVYGSDYLALGHIASDPEFGSTHSNAYFDLGRSAYMLNPFVSKDSVIGIDSVVLSLSYVAAYGDTNTVQTLRVYEIAQNSGFQDTAYYKYNQADFLTTGTELGNKTIQINKLDDSILHIRKRDTTKLANVIRIPLSSSLGQRFAQYDTTNSVAGAYRTDSLFKKLFRGLAIVADNAGNAITYIDANDDTKTKLTVYFRVKNAGAIDTTTADFFHYGGRYPYYPYSTFTVGQANIITRTAGGNWASYLANATTNDDRIFLQSIPGSYASLKIPGLDTFKNAVIHRAEIIMTPLRSTQDNIYSHPAALFLDRINAAADTAFTFDADMTISSSGGSFSYDYSLFGGVIKSDSTYRFNISRYVQNMVTKRTSNYTLRLYAPVRAFSYSTGLGENNQFYISDRAAYGRVVIAGGSYAVIPEKRMRMRLVYSKL